jgi:hypothetical protein
MSKSKAAKENSLRNFQPVSHAGFCNEILWLRRILLQLSPEGKFRQIGVVILKLLNLRTQLYLK